MWTIIKVDAQFIALKNDQPIPAKGERFYHQSPRHVLADIARECRHYGTAPADVSIYPNEHADAALIENYGFHVGT